MITVFFLVEIANGRVNVKVYISNNGHSTILLAKSHYETSTLDVAFTMARARCLFDGMCGALSDSAIRFIKWEEIPEILKESV